jgi:hypothetical protein
MQDVIRAVALQAVGLRAELDAERREAVAAVDAIFVGTAAFLAIRCALDRRAVPAGEPLVPLFDPAATPRQVSPAHSNVIAALGRGGLLPWNDRFFTARREENHATATRRRPIPGQR